jgi:hypothetical protein
VIQQQAAALSVIQTKGDRNEKRLFGLHGLPGLHVQKFFLLSCKRDGIFSEVKNKEVSL